MDTDRCSNLRKTEGIEEMLEVMFQGMVNDKIEMSDDKHNDTSNE